jgi:branched-chain amino acid transport system substrate-binding protein
MAGHMAFTDVVIAAAVPDLKIAVVYPLSGALSRNGNLTLQGAKAAMGWVNDNGGIKSLRGAKLVPVVADSGSTVEGAASAMERVCRDPEIVMAIGSWASSLTLSATEITERLGIPHFSISSADSLHERGFKWGFYVSPPMSVYGDLGLANVIKLAREAGDVPKTAMAVGDNGASSKTFYEAAKKYFSKVGIKMLGEETWPTGTLTDATPIMQKIKKSNPDMVIFSSLAISETQMCMMKRRELGIKVPFMYSGGYGGDPSFRQIGAEFLEGNICFAAFFPHKLMPPDWIERSLDQCRKEYSDEPWMGQELGFAWTMVPVMAEILERAGSRNRQTIWQIARKLDIHNVLATRATAKQGVAFDEKGRIAKKYQNILVIQWQGGVPVTVYPPELALARSLWPKTK